MSLLAFFIASFDVFKNFLVETVIVLKSDSLHVFLSAIFRYYNISLTITVSWHKAILCRDTVSNGVVHVLSLVCRGRPSGTESETEEEGSRLGHVHYDTNSITNLHQ